MLIKNIGKLKMQTQEQGYLNIYLKRKQKHLDYIYKFLVKIDTECRSLRLNMNDENQDEKVALLLLRSRNYVKLL